MITIREFQANDTFSVIKLASQTLTEKYSPSLFTYFYETFPKGFIVAESNHKIVGFLVGVILSDEFAKILMISVNPTFQRKEIGKNLLNQFIENIKKERINKIELEVRTRNKKAIDFYKKNGFKIVEKINEFYQNLENAYVMRLEI